MNDRHASRDPDAPGRSRESASARTILLFGLPRSGTTWLGKIFDSHPRTLYRHEPDSFGRLNHLPLLIPLDQAERYRAELAAFVDSLPGIRDAKVDGSLPVFPKAYYSPSRFLLRRSAVAGAKLAARMLGECTVPAVAPAAALDRAVRVWKSIESSGRLGALARTVPGCSGVFIVRHPCGYVASVRRGEQGRKFSDAGPSSEDYGIYRLLLDTPAAVRRGLDIGQVEKLTPVERLALRWMLFNEKVLEDLEHCPACMTIRYEDLCAQPVERSRELFAFTGLAWNEQTERFVTASTGHERTGYYSVYKNPAHSTTRWREELSAAEQSEILDLVKDSAPGALYDQ